jgi:phosphoglucosamine mutase
VVKNHSAKLYLPKPLHITIGRDTRASGLYLESALVSGISASGVNCELIGIMPTAAIAYRALHDKAYLGIVISASHNSYLDNGLKIFGPDGFKITHQLEQEISNLFFEASNLAHLIATEPGQISYKHDAQKNYQELLASLSQTTNQPLRLVIDCAHGAASYLAPQILTPKDSQVKIIGAFPDGHNINRDFGSEAPHRLKNEVIEFQADLGIAFDGDADRVIFADERGELIDGEAILALLAIYLKDKKLLKKDTLVTTIMSSVALDTVLAPHNISVVRTPVGDKHVARSMLENGYSFGGENSGHLIAFPLATTGDGIVSALLFLEVISTKKLPVSELMSFFKPTPKILRNIEVSHKIPLSDLPATQSTCEYFNQELNQQGRVLLRYSGTENKLRILVEAKTLESCEHIADILTDKFCTEIAHKK